MKKGSKEDWCEVVKLTSEKYTAQNLSVMIHIYIQK